MELAGVFHVPSSGLPGYPASLPGSRDYVQTFSHGQMCFCAVRFLSSLWSFASKTPSATQKARDTMKLL